jgi:uncharacterized lipoprotein YajG
MHIRRNAALLAAVLFLAGCAGPVVTQERPGWYDPQAVSHNERVCIERGMVWDIVMGVCQ